MFGLSSSEKIKVLKIEDIKIDNAIYPRKSPDWITSYKYASSMRAGIMFPPITVAKIDGEIKLVDGYHRIQAHLQNKIDTIQVNILEGLTNEQAFLKSVEMNIAHGQPLNVGDRTRVIVKLKEMKYPLEKISKIVHIPVNKIDTFIASRITTTPIGTQVVLKSSIRHLAGQPVDESIEEEQGILIGSSQSLVLENAIRLLENPKFIKDNEKTIKQLQKLKSLINTYLKGK